MTVDDTAPAVAIWRNGRTQKGMARRDRILPVDAAVEALQAGAAMVCVQPVDADAACAWGKGAQSGETIP